MSGAVNTTFVLDMQRKLYRWSSSDPDKVFADLFNLVCDRRTLTEAWQRLARNRGSRTPGTDGVTRRTVEERPGGAEDFLAEIRENLRTGSYMPQPVRQRLIPKPGRPGKFRPLGIPTLTDRLVQMALKLILEPIFEADFYPTSYGFRKGRSTHDALAKIQKSLHPTKRGPSVYAHVIEGDIKGCFDAIDHHVMMERVRRRISDRKAIRTSRWVGNLFIPKSKLNDLRYKIKALVKGVPTGHSFASLIDRLNPILTGWRNYYRYATRACRDFHMLDEWIWRRVGRWLRTKHRKAGWRQLKRRFTNNVCGERRRWVDGRARLRFLWEGGTLRYPRHGIEIPNGWNLEPERKVRKVPSDFWRNFNLLSSF